MGLRGEKKGNPTDANIRQVFDPLEDIFAKKKYVAG